MFSFLQGEYVSLPRVYKFQLTAVVFHVPRIGFFLRFLTDVLVVEAYSGHQAEQKLQTS